jgi:chromosome segregation ATPase
MRRILFAVAAFALTGAAIASADDAKPTRPAVQQLPNIGLAADEQAIAELKAKIEQLAAEAAKVAADSARANAELKLAEAELVRIQKIAMLGRVKPGTIEAAEAKVKEGKEKIEKLSKQLKAIDAALADLRAKLKEVEK